MTVVCTVDEATVLNAIAVIILFFAWKRTSIPLAFAAFGLSMFALGLSTTIAAMP